MHQLRTETLKTYALESQVLFAFRIPPLLYPFGVHTNTGLHTIVKFLNIISVKFCSNHFRDHLTEQPSKLY